MAGRFIEKSRRPSREPLIYIIITIKNYRSSLHFVAPEAKEKDSCFLLTSQT
jgi:hypothetical protein